MSETGLLFIVSTAFVVGLSGSMMPGPMLGLCISEVARRGFWAGPAIVLGHAIIELLLVIALAFGLIRFLEGELVGSIIGIVGGTVLVLMGAMIVRDAPRKRLSEVLQHSDKKAWGGPVLGGVVVSVINPYWVLWWATIGAAYVLAALKGGKFGPVVFFGGHIFSDLAWYTFVALIIATGRRFLSDRIYQGLLGACGLFMVGLGIYFMVDGVIVLV